MSVALPAQINLFSGEERKLTERHRRGSSRALVGQIDRLRQLFTLGIEYVFPKGAYTLKDLSIDDAAWMIATMEAVALESTR